MENLPLVVLRKIFEKLTNLNEIIRCSLVCKKWRLVYETYKPELLCLYTNNFVPLNKKLAFTNGKVNKFNSFHFTNVKFIDSEITRIHFANIKKLIIFSFGTWQREKFGKPKKSLQSQLNQFKSLEYVEIQDDFFYKSKGKERLNLPNLKILILLIHNNSKNQIVLNTPSLQVLIANRLYEFTFLFPQQLRYINAGLVNKTKNDFVNLKCLRMVADSVKKSLNNEFLKNLPSLKFLILFSRFDNESPFQRNLESQKRKYNLNNLKVIEHEDLFDYKNWRKYIELKEQIHRWPDGFEVDFKELINFKVPFNYFEENYLLIKILKIDHVPDQSQLVAFLKKMDFSRSKLIFKYGCNLDQYFFDEIPSYLSIECINFYGDLFYRLTDYTFITKLNFRSIYLNFHQLPYQAVWNMLKNPSFCHSSFYKFEQSNDLQKDREKNDYDLRYEFYKNEDSSYGESTFGKFNYDDEDEDEEEDDDHFQIDEIDDIVRHIEVKLKTKFT